MSDQSAIYFCLVTKAFIPASCWGLIAISWNINYIVGGIRRFVCKLWKREWSGQLYPAYKFTSWWALTLFPYPENVRVSQPNSSRNLHIMRSEGATIAANAMLDCIFKRYENKKVRIQKMGMWRIVWKTDWRSLA